MQVVLLVEESALTDCLSANNSVPIAIHEPYKSDDISRKNTFNVKKVQPSKVELHLEVNALTDW